MNPIKQWWQFFFPPRRPDCQAFCPRCRNDLTSCPTTECEEIDGLFHYKCGQCSKKTVWNFDAPVPLLVKGSVPRG
jgi:hypothetical protein